ncbi:MAG: potassium transporter TrkA [Gloeocapsa sp. DLM2.Bin57]|nr:MAG: potassium transporter TrkA [Gloeocapsa sp. DLM2.Bin57]
MDNYFLVCGLGSLGQNCVVALKKFNVPVIAIEQEKTSQPWEIPQLLLLLDDIILGDCRQTEVLQKAKIAKCRAALIVTSNEKVNAETAIAIRQLNPNTRLVVRSSKENLNILLGEQLGNFIAYEPIQLPASAFALAALGTEILGLFSLDKRRIRITRRQINSKDPWSNNKYIYEINNKTRRLLTHTPDHYAQIETNFHQWDGELKIQNGDILIYAEVVDDFKEESVQISPTRQNWRQKLVNLRKSWKPFVRNFGKLSLSQQIRGVAVISGFVVMILLMIGTILFERFYEETNLVSAFYATATLLLGGYADLLGDFEPNESIPWWLQLFAFILNLMGTAFVGILYALLTEALLSSKFEFTKSRPPIPQANHIVIVGLGRVGCQVASLLQELGQDILGISFNQDFDRSILPKMPLIVGNLNEALAKANLKKASSVVVVTDDEMLNLEIALMAKTANPRNNLVIRTDGQDLSNNLSKLLPEAKILEAYQLASEAFAGAAFGENIIAVCPIENQNILVTEYQIEVDDTLKGLLISEVAYGYGVEVIAHAKPSQNLTLMPSDDLQLVEGDRLVVLATVEGLQRIEEGQLNLDAKQYFIRVEKALNSEAAFSGANLIVLISGCSVPQARELFQHLPATLDVPLYKQQANRLVRGLNKRQVKAIVLENRE